jgi:endoglucanase
MERMKYLNKILLFFIMFLFLFSCQKEGTVDPVLLVSRAEIAFEPEGGEATVEIECNDEWGINNSASSWLQVDKTGGTSGNTTLNLTISVNKTGATRTGIVSINATNGLSKRVVVKQGAWLFPSYNTSPKAPDATGMNSTAVQLAAKMGLGWNIGNTMEAPGGESGWGNPVITEDYVKFVKQQGFNAIRIPCAWDWNWDSKWYGNNYHIEDRNTARIKTEWLNRVKEVVGYCVNNDMYVLLNIHYDGGWLEHNITKAKQDSVCAKQKAYWEQIATAMRDFDEHLMFASANEPNAGNAEQMEVLLSYHQTFVNAVRSTGGRNTYRSLVIQGSHLYLNASMFPTDPTSDRMMYEEHNYTPSQFTFLGEDVSWGNMVYYWGEGHHSTIEPDRNPTYGEEDAHIEFFQKMKSEFIDKGIPVLMGEYGAYRRNNNQYVPKDLETHNDAVDYWITFVTSQAVAHGVVPFWWDTGGALDRANYTVKDQRTIDAIMAGGQ